MALPATYQQLADDLMATLKADLGQEWEQVKAEYQAKLRASALLWAKLEWRAATGQIVLTDVERAQMAAHIQLWTGAGLARVRKGFWQSAHKVSSTLGAAAGTFILGVLSGLV